MWHLRWTAKMHTRHKRSKEWKWRLYEGRKAINEEIKSAHWVSFLFIVVQGRTSIYLWTSYLPKQKRNLSCDNSRCQKDTYEPVTQQKQSYSWAGTWEKFLSWLLLQRTGWCGKQYPSQHPITDLRTYHTQSRMLQSHSLQLLQLQELGDCISSASASCLPLLDTDFGKNQPTRNMSAKI